MCLQKITLVILAIVVSPSVSVKNYSSALGASILFYDAQRSGPLPANNPIKWRGDSALTDCVVGGWYNGADFLKFGLPMASSAEFLLWSLYKWKDAYVGAGQLTQMYDMVKWPLDYFLKAWNSAKQELVYQVGEENVEYAYWGRPEDMTHPRPCKVASAAHPGSDVAGATAAALALGALVFEDQGDSAYSKQLLASATSLYKFAVAHRGPYQTGIYTSDKDTDELCLAAVWLYRATHLVEYLDAAKNFVSHDSSWGLTLESKDLSCQQLLFEETQDSTYRRSITDYFNNWLPGGTVQYTPCGLAWRMKWGPLGTAAKSAFLALLAADSGIEQDRYQKWAVEQINYILGDNPHNGGCFSYEVGYSSKYPLQPDHRAASCPDRPAPCGHEQSSSTEPNPQILTGAIVGGPDEYDQYVDSRPDWVHNEVQVDYNAGFQAALAGIVHLQNVNLFPATNNKCPCNQ
ncbi:endoglucanase A [Biomphalaria pfeifferi]|uniref:cellulase n=1 Tax=Biomphalaria pfeifferi TaxID=112525 RepID=A0AAD8FD26_BIOPF|nr:endoglucanase A [Biomphalaria pfeifferi]